ncbi:hydroxymethylpyrimidine/phosphomethylpyrimidine kinase [Alcanivorax sp. JB21]|uniref:bifunctional hydroxymethylpyrimidine kinase/phosphomethylpyrimidine kinase n=1 Tax=Alcanivorax limicola TaxID=2874102 RepID=UPI001CBCFED8|nr:hydroxymethylpyrimidine/phosphomethylpyrimidine kinase [Alcanivorax limicola]MBZ2189449.1 hydroxymethylpyrimidine/phosphomethylpyrimidine kinase [Alcanivorax limicola]
MKPNVLVIAGHDPSGGAGIHADIEAIHSLGGFAATLITGLTVQNSSNVQGFELVSEQLLQRQAEALLADMRFDAVKIGMTGSPGIIHFIADLLDRLPGVPVVLDPVLAAEAGGRLAADSVPDAMLRELLPRATLATPNLPEAQKLAGNEDLATCGTALCNAGCPAVLITGTHDDTPQVRNHLYTATGAQQWAWPRLPGSYHGSGCTLASACAALLAAGQPLEQAVEQAQAYVHQALRHAWQAGQGQLIPDRRRHD